MASFIDSSGDLIEYDDTLETGESGSDGSSGSKQGQGGAGKADGGAGGKAGAVVFGGTGNYDHTNVFNLTTGDDSIYYKVLVSPVDGGDSISNNYQHDSSIMAFITGVNIQQRTRQQVSYTLGNTVYLYVFGDSVTDLSISGFGFWKCMGSDTFKLPDELLDFYKNNNVSATGKYCKVLLGDKTFLGYLIESEVGLTDQSLGLVAFKFHFIGVFQDNE